MQALVSCLRHHRRSHDAVKLSFLADVLLVHRPPRENASSRLSRQPFSYAGRLCFTSSASATLGEPLFPCLDYEPRSAVACVETSCKSLGVPSSMGVQVLRICIALSVYSLWTKRQLLFDGDAAQFPTAGHLEARASSCGAARRGASTEVSVFAAP